MNYELACRILNISKDIIIDDEIIKFNYINQKKVYISIINGNGTRLEKEKAYENLKMMDSARDFLIKCVRLNARHIDKDSIEENISLSLYLDSIISKYENYVGFELQKKNILGIKSRYISQFEKNPSYKKEDIIASFSKQVENIFKEFYDNNQLLKLIDKDLLKYRNNPNYIINDTKINVIKNEILIECTRGYIDSLEEALYKFNKYIEENFKRTNGDNAIIKSNLEYIDSVKEYLKNNPNDEIQKSLEVLVKNIDNQLRFNLHKRKIDTIIKRNEIGGGKTPTGV